MVLEWKGHTFFDQEALVDRLTEGALISDKEVVFVVGAPLTAPTQDGGKGIADVSAVVELIRDHFSSGKSQLEKLDQALESAANPYQAAFTYLQGRRSQDVANRIIQQAVLQARLGTVQTEQNLNENNLADLERDIENWHLSAGVEALGDS